MNEAWIIHLNLIGEQHEPALVECINQLCGGDSSPHLRAEFMPRQCLSRLQLSKAFTESQTCRKVAGPLITETVNT